jgi:thiamine pyrophosphokinase
MTRFAILLGGDLTPTERLLRQVAGCRSIAADSGMAHAASLQLAPELWVGDFDSAGTELAAAFAHVPRKVYPEDKTATDGELAVDEAVRLGATSLVLVGGFGGQSDHMLGHMTMLLALAARGISAFTSSGHEEAYPLIDHVRPDGLKKGTRVSVVGLTALRGLTISGVRWPLTGRDVPLGSSLTISNKSTGEVTLELASGRAVVLVYP